MKTTASLTLFLFFLNLSFISKANIPEMIFTEYTLENGLHVILHQDHSTPNVTVNVMYHVGAKNDPPDRTGFAHFFEHLMFEGSKHIGRGEFDRLVESAGGQLNAVTTHDITNYFILMPSNYLERALWMEAERMLHPVIDSIGIATQKDVVTEEMQQVRDNAPYGRWRTELFATAFSVHPYQNDVLGSAEHIRSATYEEIIAFHQQYYVPDNAVLVIAGDFDKVLAKEWIEKYFGDIPRGIKQIQRSFIREPKQSEQIRHTVYDNVQLPLLVKGFRVPGKNSKDYFALEIARIILSEGQSSKLHSRLVDQEKVALQANSFPLFLEDSSLMSFILLPNMGIEPEKLEQLFWEELDAFRKSTITDRQLQQALNQLESQFIRGRRDINTRALNLAFYYTFHNNTDFVNEEFTNFSNVTTEDIQRIVNKYFIPENCVVLYYMPAQ
ncbi:MAG: insulinase family protein [Bacteroidetes bacterium]|nr:MAG: insulinase family protein [Bacteroidota bacterium]